MLSKTMLSKKALPTKSFRPKLLSMTLALVGVLSLSACQSVGTTTKTATPIDLQKQLYQANVNLLAGDSFDFSQKSTLTVSKNDWEGNQEVLNAFFERNHVTSEQKERVLNMFRQTQAYESSRDRFLAHLPSIFILVPQAQWMPVKA